MSKPINQPAQGTPPASDALREALDKIAAARKELSAMCDRQWHGKGAIQWSIPARPGVDSDLIIGAALDAAEAALRAPAPVADTLDYRALYHELLYQVATKHPDESRHETALRYLRDHETRCGKGGPVADRGKGDAAR